MSLTYSETVSQAAERLEVAAQAADAAGWGAFLRDKYDVWSSLPALASV